jgi:hypothetical protein
MPPRKNYKNKNSKKKPLVKRKYNKKAYSRKTNMVRAPFGNTMFTVVTYGANFTLTQVAAGVPIARTFRANSAFDPDIASGGTSARFFETLCGADNTHAPYNEYRVLATAVTLTAFQQTNTATGGNVLLGCRFRLYNAGFNQTLDQMLSSRNSTYRYLGNADGNKGIVKVKAYKKMKDMLGVKDIMDDKGSAAIYAQDPLTSSLVYLDVEQCAVSDTGISNVSYILTIKQYVQFLTPNTERLSGY